MINLMVLLLFTIGEEEVIRRILKITCLYEEQERKKETV